MTPGPLAIAAVLGLVAGWAAHPVLARLTGVAPRISWLPPLTIWFVAAILGVTAWLTHRALHVHHERLEPYRAVNRLVLARASALSAAVVAGAYSGYAISWMGMQAELAGERITRSSFAAAGGLVMLVASVLLERACRVQDMDGEP